jgi:Protein of unknown function (DUF992)
MKALIRAAIAALCVGLLQTAAFAPAASAQNGMSIKTGVLTCQVASGFGYIIGSTRTLNCTYLPGNGHEEDYTGTISKIGIDIGYLGAYVLVWAVVAPRTGSGPGALAGTYVGATAQAVAGLGGGVNVMTGGFQDSVALQPVSLEGNSGLYVGAGIASMTLELNDN